MPTNRTNRYIFEGHSDDTFGEYGVTADDYDNCNDGTPIHFELKTSIGAGLIITGLFTGDRAGVSRGCGWMIGVAAIDEYKPVDWPVTMEPSFNGYSNRCIIEAPADAVLRCLTREGDADDGE